MKPSRAPRIVVIGSSNTDLVVRCSRLPAAGETIAGGTFTQHAGGKGANQAVAAARAGAKVCFVGACGDDPYGKAARAALRAEKIDVRSFTTVDSMPSGVALIFVSEKTGENSIAVARSANDKVSAAQVEGVSATIARSDLVLAQLEVPLEAVQAAASVAARFGVPFLLNPAPAQKLPRILLRQVHTLTPNETEAELLTGLADYKPAARELLRRGCRNVVVTLGAKGAWVCGEDGEALVRAPRVRAVDSVGAGDCFTAWLAVGLAEGLPLFKSAARATEAAAIAVTRAGAQSGMPRIGEVPSRPRARVK